MKFFLDSAKTDEIEYALEMLGGSIPQDKETPVDLITAETLESQAK